MSNPVDRGGAFDSWFAASKVVDVGSKPFGAEQGDVYIASAIGNRGTHDPLGADITQSLQADGAAQDMATEQSVRAAIAEMVRVDPQSFHDEIGNLVVTTSGQVAAEIAFNAWFEGSQIVDGDDQPLVVFHGTNAHAYTGGEIAAFNTRPASGRGGTFFTNQEELASQYGEKVYAVYLSVKNPLIVLAGGKGWTSLGEDAPVGGLVTNQLRVESDRAAKELTELFREMDGLFDDDESESVVASPKVPPGATNLAGRKLGDLPGLSGGELETDSIVKAARKLGYDGVVFKDVQDSPTTDAGYKRLLSDVYVAFHPEQIKSVTANFGTYDPLDPNIAHSLTTAATGLPTRVQAWHDGRTKTTVFLADRIAAGREGAVFLHEVVHRHGRQALPEGRWSALVGQVKAWAQAKPQSPERAIHDVAQIRVVRAGVAGALADEELFAYAVEEAVAMGIEPTAAAVTGSAQAWLQVVLDSIQRVAERLIGNDLQQLGGQDLVDLAYALAQLDSPVHGFEVRRALGGSLADLPEIDGVRRTASIEQERAYAEAVLLKQRRQALRVLHAAAGVVTLDYSFDRNGAHPAPDPVEGAPMWDAARGIYPEDLYQGRMREYGTSSIHDAEVFECLRRTEGLPNAFVTVYRAVETGGAKKILPGDWVTPARGYAKEHGEDNISGPFKTISEMVRARDLFTDGNSVLEWGYHPQDFMPEFPKSDAAKARTLQERLDALAACPSTTPAAPEINGAVAEQQQTPH